MDDVRRVRLVERERGLEQVDRDLLGGEGAALLEEAAELLAAEQLQMNGVPVSSSTPASEVRTMWSLSMMPVMRASRAKRARSSSLSRRLGSITLSARRAAVTSSITSYTAPMPPALMTRST
ncbi:hypothetical protein BE20_37135 [Sorangium cellulosum]|nr:hypothetical protein BE20_37135 [Sorangium cellulosum]